MADLSISISNTIEAFAGSPATKWNATTWNGGLWGADEDVYVAVDKGIAEAVSSDTSLALDFIKTISESITVTSRMTGETLSQGVYSYVFPSNTTELEDRDFPTWTAAAAGSTTWTASSTTSTTWS